MRPVFLCVLPLLLISILAYQPNTPPLRVGLTLKACDGPLYLASILQFWSPEDAKLNIYSTDNQAINAFKEGKIDAVSLYPHEVLTLWSENIPATIILVLEVSNGADTIVAHSSIANLSDLKGKTIAIDNNPNNLYMLNRAMESATLQESDITLVNFTPDAHYSAFKKGELHAVTAKRSHIKNFIDIGGNELFTSRNIPGEIAQVLVVNPAFLDHSANQVDALITNWFKVMHYIESNPNSSTKQIAKWLDVEPDNLYWELSTMQLTNRDDNIRMLVGEGASIHITLNKLRDTMLKHNLLAHSPPVEHMVNDSFVR